MGNSSTLCGWVALCQAIDRGHWVEFRCSTCLQLVCLCLGYHMRIYNKQSIGVHTRQQLAHLYANVLFWNRFWLFCWPDETWNMCEYFHYIYAYFCIQTSFTLNCLLSIALRLTKVKKFISVAFVEIQLVVSFTLDDRFHGRLNQAE